MEQVMVGNSHHYCLKYKRNSFLTCVNMGIYNVERHKNHRKRTSDKNVCADFCAPTWSRYSYTYSANLKTETK